MAVHWFVMLMLYWETWCDGYCEVIWYGLIILLSMLPWAYIIYVVYLIADSSCISVVIHGSVDLALLLLLRPSLLNCLLYRDSSLPCSFSRYRVTLLGCWAHPLYLWLIQELESIEKFGRASEGYLYCMLGHFDVLPVVLGNCTVVCMIWCMYGPLMLENVYFGLFCN
jgi:hypothetical protein